MTEFISYVVFQGCDDPFKDWTYSMLCFRAVRTRSKTGLIPCVVFQAVRTRSKTGLIPCCVSGL